MSIGIPSNLSVGSHYLLAKADADDVLFENQENNNIYLRTLTVGPDLIVSVLTVPAVAAPGAAVVADYSVRNQGASQAAASTLRFFWSANSALDAMTLNSHSWVSHQSTAQAPPPGKLR